MSTTDSIEKTLPGEEIVISGIAGSFPQSDNVKEFKNNLLNKKDMVSSDNCRWKIDHPDIPRRVGIINNVEKFDSEFFDIPYNQTQIIDPMSRILLEHAYEAIVDAGVNPKQLRGSRTGVFIGVCFSECELIWLYDKVQHNFGFTGSRCMLANRISYWLGVTGPSHSLDSACNSSLVAIDFACRCIMNGQCDDALVGGTNLCLHPSMALQFSRLGILSPDGRSKVFDNDADGYARSEAISVIYLQKAKNAKRIYATIIGNRVNSDGYKEEGITFPSSKMQSLLIKECYNNCNLSPNVLSYLECHGTGTKVGDPEELSAIETTICKERTAPLLIGSVKSNIGHSEAGSGLTQVIKMIIAMEIGIIPPNLHYNRPQESSKALKDGTLKVVTEPTPWNGGYVGISSFGFGGINCHIILKSNPKNKINNETPSDNLPRLVTLSGRTEESIKVFLDDIERHSLDTEYIHLIHNIYSENITGHLYRGFTIVGSKTSEHTIKETENYLGTARPIWFVFSGMGSQWPGMGADLMKFPVFAKAIKKCDAILQPRGVDIINIVTNKDKTIFDNILHSFVGIAAIQIGLVDLITSINIVPDNIIGHSIGELGCAYADGCLTAEQIILSAYLLGLASIKTKVIYGLMAEVGLGYDIVKDMCPSDIDVACHNSADSSIISGPADSIKDFIAQLQAKQIFVKEVPCSNIPYHSRYIASARTKLLAYLNDVIPGIKPHSWKWVSTSVPRNKWSTVSAKLSSAEYYTNNLLSPVLFEETARMIPKNAVTIEIAPHGLLQSILKRSLGSEVTNIALTQRNGDNVEFLLQAIGKLYNIGLQLNIASLYPSVEYPVSRGTPMISPSIRWKHSYDWFLPKYDTQFLRSGERIVTFSLNEEDTEFINGHVIDGKVLIPATGYLVSVWETFSMLQNEFYSELSVVFENVSFIRATHMPKEGSVELRIMIQKGTGKFEVTENDTVIVTGLIRTVKNIAQEKIPAEFLPKNDEEEVMNTKDIYKELKLRGYQYSGMFRSLKSASKSGKKGHIDWIGNWVTFLDNMMQISILELVTQKLFVPTNIQKIVIDTKLHRQEIQKLNFEDKRLAVHVYKDFNTIVSGGVEIRGVRAAVVPRRLPAGDPVLEEYKFVAHRDGAQVSLREGISLSVQIMVECHASIQIKTIEVIHDSDNITEANLASPMLSEILGDIPVIQATVYLSAPFNRFNNNLFPNVTSIDINNISKEENIQFAVGIDLLSVDKKHQLNQIILKLKNGGFILTREKSFKPENLSTLSKYDLDVILEKSTGEETLILLKKKTQLYRKTEIIYVNNDEFTWLEKLKLFMNEKNTINNTRIILVSEGDLESGLLGFVNCLRLEPGGEIIKSVLIQDIEAPKFSLQNPLYLEQLQLDLPINVLRPLKRWGSYRHQLLSSLQPKFVPYAYVAQMIPGDLSSFCWVEGPPSDIDQKDLVYVVYAPLNFKDVMTSTGKITGSTINMFSKFYSNIIGLEYVGIDATGRRIMGIVQGVMNVIKPDKVMQWIIPDNWSLEDAATIPCVYATCCIALHLRGKMKKGDKVLIHCGTGGIGQAAIHLALHEGCEVYTTVGTPEKRKFIHEIFPSIPDDHIGNSRNTSFEQMILQQTNGKGVDIVLNSLAEEKLLASVRCLAQGGRFLEIGKFDLNANNPLEMMMFLKGITFHGIMLDNLFTDLKDFTKEKIEIKNLVDKYLQNGAIKPLTRIVYKKDELETAIRYMAAGKHMGKVILKICDENEVLEKKPILASPRYYCDSNKTYLILGGLGGFGLELTNWLIIRGAKNIVLTSRTGIKNGYQHMKLERWKSYGVNVLIISGADASNRKDCEFILNSAEKQGSVDAIFNLAVVLKDKIFINQTPELFEESFKAKARATKMVDELSRSLCPKLRHFVVFSSVSCGRGNSGQTNYGMGNSIMERICERRVADGLPGLAIQWGTIGEVGLVADSQENNKELVIGGTLQQQISSCLEKLEHFLLQNYTIVSSMVVAEKRRGAYGASNIVEAVTNILGVKDLKTVSQQTPLTELGMDSMMAVEIKQTLEREFDVFLTAQDIRTLNFAKLIEIRDKDLNEKTEKKQSNEQTGGLSGIHLFIRFVSLNTNLSSEICVELETKMDPHKMKVFLVPDLKGCSQIFNPLAFKIKSAATVLQYGVTKAGIMSISEYADHLLSYILPEVEEQNGFTLVGYSYGVLITLELTRRLEKRGFNGRVVLIDGAPDFLKILLEQFLPSSTEEELQNNVLLALMDNVQSTLSGKLLLDLEKCTTWNKKIEVFMSHVPKDKYLQYSSSIKYVDLLCTITYKHCLALQKYDVSSLKWIQTPITLLKPTVQLINMADEDYGLHKISRGKVDIHYIEGNHYTILDSDTVISAINGESLLDPKASKNLLSEHQPLEYQKSERSRV